jgi:hypothetical protein
VNSQLSAALRAAAAGIHPDEAAAGLVISHGTFLARGDCASHIETAADISDGTPMACDGHHGRAIRSARRNGTPVALACRREPGATAGK